MYENYEDDLARVVKLNGAVSFFEGVAATTLPEHAFDGAVEISQEAAAAVNYLHSRIATLEADLQEVTRQLAEERAENTVVYADLDDEGLALAIKTARVKHGMSAREFAERLGVSAGTVGSWEHGRRSPRASSREKLVTLLEGLDA